MSFSAGPEFQVLGPGIGYGIIAGIGAAFTLIMILSTQIQNRYSAHSTKQSEEFNTASRSVKPGLIAAGIVSSVSEIPCISLPHVSSFTVLAPCPKFSTLTPKSHSGRGRLHY
jgi:hypothetical protein